MLDINNFNEQLFAFLDASPTPYHAVKSQIRVLQKNGFKRLLENQQWLLEPGQRYYVTRNGSSLIAFVYGREDSLKTGIRMLGAHTDSPCLKVKPNADIKKKSYLQLAVEVYGGALLNPWFDRDLSLAGKVVYQDSHQAIHSCLINFVKPIAIIPSLAIHLDREANKNHSINAQTDIPPILLTIEHDDKKDNMLKSLLTEQLKQQNNKLDIVHIIDYELSFYDAQPASLLGMRDDFISSSRLDNLLSCFICLQALLSADDQGTSLLICTDHEEVGSASQVGAQGTFLQSVLQRLSTTAETLSRIISRSMMISADNAHALHPNFTDKHDANHGPVLNQGPVIKVNANQRYASTCETAALFKMLAEKINVPVQHFVVRSDMGCGSTIGPIAATNIGIKTVDIGVPTLAMHSIREMAGSKDGWYLYQVLEQYFDCSNGLNIVSTEF